MRLLLSLALCVIVMSSSAVVAAVPDSQAHLRPQDERLAQLLRDGASRSATLKALVDRIEASNVIVYVALNPMMKSHLAGMLTWMTRAGKFRYIRASISTDLNRNQTIATIAHELQHAVEVIDDESVNDEKSLVALYRRIGQQHGNASPSRWKPSPHSKLASRSARNLRKRRRRRSRVPETWGVDDDRVRSCYAVSGKRAPLSVLRLACPTSRMYEDYYGFVQPPFSLTPDPRFLYRSESHDVALQQVWQAIRRKEGFIVLTGDIGTGKTTLCRTLLEQFDQTTFTALILNPFLSVEELLREVLLSFGVVSKDAMKSGRLATASKHELVRTLHDFLLSLVPLHGSAVLIIDEAQHLSADVLEEIRVLSNLETNDQKLLQVVIVGQLNLLEILQRAELRQLDQRISIRCSLKALTREEVEAYVTHRLWVARGSTSVTFTPKAFDLVHSISGGVPRMINLVCDRALMVACEKQTSRITEEHVVGAAAQLGQDIPKGKIKGERAAGTTAPASRRTLLIAAAAAATVAAIAAAIVLLSNPLELLSSGVAPAGPRPPARALPAMLAVPAAPVDGPAATPIPPPILGSFSILIGTYDNARDVQRVETLLKAQSVTPYAIDILMAPDDLQRRVLLGRFVTREDAEAARLKLGTALAVARVIPGNQERLRVIIP